MDQRQRNDLDNYITGHYGEDQFRGDEDVEESQDVEAAPCFVSVMHYDRYYGGPEEGGWYYTRYERVESVFCNTNQEMEEALVRFEAEYSNEGRPSVSSVLSEGRYQIRVTNIEQPLFDPPVRPHYE